MKTHFKAPWGHEFEMEFGFGDADLPRYQHL
ncbi:MAG: hypothetical protein RIS79_1487 [Verrucomicrobiota bacterium]|jgi:hypothetical protein